VSKPKLYSPEWVEAQQYTQEWSSRALLAVFAHLGLPKAMLDLGCGDGHLCWLAAQLGVLSVGVDIALPHDSSGDNFVLRRRDLRCPLSLSREFDLVISWEMGEHLPEDAADVYVESIARHVGKHLVFTAAAPDQGGEGHLNCQPQEWWRKKLRARGLLYLPAETERLRDTWAWATGPCFWYVQNVQVFVKAARDG